MKEGGTIVKSMTNMIDKKAFVPTKILYSGKYKDEPIFEVKGYDKDSEDDMIMTLFITQDNVWMKIDDRLYKYRKKNNFYQNCENTRVMLDEIITRINAIISGNHDLSYYYFEDDFDVCTNPKEYYWNFSEDNNAVDITNKNSIEKALSDGVWQVTFNKRNGELRKMVCTRDFDYIKDNSQNWVTPKGVRVPPNSIITVWDLEKNAWRSFRIDSILYMKKLSTDIREVRSIQSVDYNKIKSDLSKGIYKIMFRTLNGALYETIGTRDWDLVGLTRDNKSPGTNRRVIPENQIIYWDLNAKNYRSFRAESLIKLHFMSDKMIDLNNPNIKITKDEFQKMLDENIMEVIFEKRDGSIRTMKCTGNFEYIKKNYYNDYYDYDGNRYNNIFLVWDLEKMDYRNIRYDSIMSFKILDKI